MSNTGIYRRIPAGLLTAALLILPVAGYANPKIDFNTQCAACHRSNANMLKKAKQLDVHPDKLALKNSKMSREEMIAVVQKGRDKMPGFEKELSKEQIEEVVDYVLALKNRKVNRFR